VPFSFCPRSVMLYILFAGNRPDLSYGGGQGPIIHLQADLMATVQWANGYGVHWAFTDRNAGTRYTSFYADLSRLDKVNWEAVQATDFRDSVIKDGKQAEFLVHESLPWELIERIGVIDSAMVERVERLAGSANHHPVVAVERKWYF